MNKFIFDKCEKGIYLCIEVLNDAPDIHQLTGFCGFDKGNKKYAIITNVIEIGNKPWSVKFDILKSSEKNLILYKSFLDKNETDIWNIEPNFWNPFGGKFKFYFCTRGELPKNILQKIISKIINILSRNQQIPFALLFHP